jgi:hypothetical protein
MQMQTAWENCIPIMKIEKYTNQYKYTVRFRMLVYTQWHNEYFAIQEPKTITNLREFFPLNFT